MKANLSHFIPFRRKHFVKSCKQFLSLILISSLLAFSIQPAASAAYGDTAEDYSQNVGESDQSDTGSISTTLITSNQCSNSFIDPHEDIPILEEREELRESNIKHFLREDMSMEAVVYPMSVHYEKDGEWTDIDNRLIAVTENGETVYRNREADYIVTFSPEAKAEEWVKIEKSGASVSWKLSEADFSTANDSEAVVENAEALSLDPRILPNLSSQITYPDVFDGVDVTYTIDSAGVREYIIIESAARAAGAYTFDVTVDGVVPSSVDNAISLSAGDEELFRISAPLVTDSAGNICEEVALQLVPVTEDAEVMSGGAELTTGGQEPGQSVSTAASLDALGGGDVDWISALDLSEDESFTFSYRMIPDEEWMNDPERVWPVIVDPDVVVDSSQITDTFVASNQTGNVYQTAAYIQLGYDSYTGVGRAYYKLNSLPELNPADMFVSAAIYIMRLNAPNTGYPVILYPVTQSWSASSICWNNKPSYDSSDAIAMAMSYPEGVYNHWNITELMKRWYNGEANYGFMLKAEDETVGKIEYHTGESSNSGAYPFISVVYVNARGIEDRWSYHSQSIGRAGTGYVNDATGSLTLIHQDMYVGGGSQDMSITHVYNGHEREIDLGFGLGWRTGYTQHVAPETISGMSYYKHIDGDGTTHYYYQSSDTSVFINELDPHTTLSLVGGLVVIEDAIGNQLKFDAYQRLHQIVDTHGNTQTITYVENSYSSWKISYVTDADGNKTTFTYNSSNHLTGIDCHNGQDLAFTYNSGGYLTGITYVDGKSSQYRYHSNGYMSSACDHSGYKVFYDYGGSTVLKVTGIREYADAGTSDTDLTGATAGGSLSISYGVNVTTFTDNQDRTELVRFDNTGQPLSVQDAMGRAAYGTYSIDEGMEDELTSLSEMQKTSVNLLKNGDVDSTTGWSVFKSSDTGTTSADRSATQGFMGNDSLYLTKESGEGRLAYLQYFTPTVGKTYTFSAYLKGAEGAIIFIQTYNGSTWTIIGRQTALTSSDEWNRTSVTGTVPAGATNASVVVMLPAGVSGTLYADCLQLEEGELSRYNLLTNSDFTTGTTGWTGTGLSSSDTVGTIPDGGNRPESLSTAGYKINGATGTEKYISQTVNISGSAGDTFVYGGWMKANSLALVHTSYGFYGLKQIQLYFMKDSTQVGYFDLNFQDGVEDWQYLCGEATAPAAYTSVVIKCYYGKNLGEAWFDGLQLYKEGFGEAYTYTDGLLIQVVDKEKKATEYEYDDNHNVTKVTGPYGDVTEYEYNDTQNCHNVTKVTSLDTITEYTYDSRGNVTSTKVYGSGSTGTYLSSSAGYTTAGGYQSSLTDALGNKANFSYDTVKGQLAAAMDPFGNSTAYTYDSMGRVGSVTAKTASGSTAATVTYDYSGDDLSTITRNDMSYSLETDGFGNTTSISAEESTLVTHTYNHARGFLTKSVYGNGYTLNYEYDAYDRLVSVKEGSTTVYTAYYDGDGRLYRTTDGKTGITTQYDYDLSGKLVRAVNSDGTSYRYIYDDKDSLTGIKQTAGGRTWTNTYAYDAQYRPTKTIIGNSSGGTASTITSTYDTLSRLTRQVYDLTTDYTITLGYTAGANGSQSTQLSSYQNGSESAYQYTYDANGNIRTITYDGKTVTYTYDSLNQLTREDNQFLNKSIVYAYNEGGNLTSKKEYAYTTGTLGTATSTISYTYGNTWKDQLTAYNGQSISYDAIGNPTSYRGWTFGWSGRNLTSISKSGTTGTYTYNNDDLRTTKTVGGVTTTYTYQGSLLMAQQSTDKNLYFSYDSSGKAVSVNYNGTEYYYLRNGQGDIVGLLDQSGTKVVSYTYDSWGKLISTEGTLASTLGVDNPLRYRGYYYDVETGLYYLQSRYYDPETGRFINADDVSMLGADGTPLSYNLYAYCLNNPVNRTDESGTWSLPNWAKVVIGVAAITVGVVATAVTGGAATAVLVASVKIAATSAAVGAVSGAGISAVSHRITTGSWDGAGKSALSGAIDGACDGFMWGGITAGATFTTVAAKGVRIQEIGRLKPSNKSGDGYLGVKYEAPKANGKYTTKSIELHSPHGSGPHDMWHWQQNTWNPFNNSISAKAKHWSLFGRTLQ